MEEYKFIFVEIHLRILRLEAYIPSGGYKGGGDKGGW